MDFNPVYTRAFWHRCLVMGLILLSVACSSTPLETTAEMVRAEQTIARAEQARVAEYAAIELAEARQKLQSARRALLERDRQLADRFALEARLDAELAIARADLGLANSVNTEMKDSLDILQQEMLLQHQGNQP